MAIEADGDILLNGSVTVSQVKKLDMGLYIDSANGRMEGSGTLTSGTSVILLANGGIGTVNTPMKIKHGTKGSLTAVSTTGDVYVESMSNLLVNVVGGDYVSVKARGTIMGATPQDDDHMHIIGSYVELNSTAYRIGTRVNPLRLYCNDGGVWGLNPNTMFFLFY